MPNVTISVGGREFDVACQEGEEPFLHSAAKMLDAEADVLVKQIGRMPEARMLLMAGLMLADKTAGMHEQLGKAQGEIKALEARIEALNRGRTAEPADAERDLSGLETLARRAEALADRAGSLAAE